jgi:predicted amidohydrolase
MARCPHEHWRVLLRARAVANQAWVVATNTAGTDEGILLGDHSAVVAPDGSVVAEAGTGEELLSATLDTGASRRHRESFPFLDDRRFGVHLTPRRTG